ncbi:protein-glutamate O-methyltransferase CheR [Rhodococcus sp. X156]|uniref:CheR family methyltransferase n=1 Tax=Rhodococcus sp. X156 TaxID=2499145 RepID=UPI000FDB677B|nr:protein-glutamate O-methyltransferase CheR [Rhodococcus sp. X156]
MSIGAPEFQFVAALLLREAAIVLLPGKEYLVEARLSPLVRGEGLTGVSELVRAAQHPDARQQRWAIVEALTTNETSWLRDPGVFAGLRTELLPRLLLERERSSVLRLWSAAASTGQEAYSLAMVLDDMHRSDEMSPQQRFEVLGTDLSHAVLTQARAGRYSQLEMSRGLPPTYRDRYFTQDGPTWQVRDVLRRQVSFRQRNLVDAFTTLPTFDVIFLRNVLIYLDPAHKTSILRRATRVLAPNGWIVLGTAESTRGLTDDLEQERFAGLSAYRSRTSAAVHLTRKG